MRALIQRVAEASVSIDGEVVGAIGPGLLVLLGVSRDDTDEDASYIVGKVVNLRIFSDDEGKFQSSATDIGAELLVVSQFTLYGETRKGRRPSFTLAAAPRRCRPSLRARRGSIQGDGTEGGDWNVPGLHGRGAGQ